MLLESPDTVHCRMREQARVPAGYHLVSLLALILILMVETYYRDSLYQSSLGFIKDIQAGASDTAATLWSLYSNVGVASAVGVPPLVLFLVYWRRIEGLYYAISLTAMLFLMNVTKLWYHEARPYWSDSDIRAFDCSTQFGNPSGHSLFSMGAAMIIWLDFNDHASKKDDESWMKKLWVRLPLLLVALVFSFTIGYSRLFLGVHTWNQTLFGWQFGLWLALTIQFCYKGTLLYHMDKIQTGKADKYLPYIAWTLVLFLLVNAIETVNVLLVTPRVEADPMVATWTKNILAACPNANMEEAFAAKSEI